MSVGGQDFDVVLEDPNKNGSSSPDVPVSRQVWRQRRREKVTL